MEERKTERKTNGLRKPYELRVTASCRRTQKKKKQETPQPVLIGLHDTQYGRSKYIKKKHSHYIHTYKGVTTLLKATYGLLTRATIGVALFFLLRQILIFLTDGGGLPD